MKTLVIAEKPSVGRDIGRVLHCQGKGNGSLEGGCREIDSSKQGQI